MLDDSPWPDTRRFRDRSSPASPLPNWWPDHDGPLIYVTFGSVLGHLPEARGVFRCALGALAAGLPLVICPLFADQTSNGRLVEQAGAGVVLKAREPARGGLGSLGPGDVDPLRRAIETVLRAPSHVRMARQIAGEIARTPTLEDTFATLLSDMPDE